MIFYHVLILFLLFSLLESLIFLILEFNTFDIFKAFFKISFLPILFFCLYEFFLPNLILLLILILGYNIPLLRVLTKNC